MTQGMTLEAQANTIERLTYLCVDVAFAEELDALLERLIRAIRCRAERSREWVETKKIHTMKPHTRAIQPHPVEGNPKMNVYPRVESTCILPVEVVLALDRYASDLINAGCFSECLPEEVANLLGAHPTWAPLTRPLRCHLDTVELGALIDLLEPHLHPRSKRRMSMSLCAALEGPDGTAYNPETVRTARDIKARTPLRLPPFPSALTSYSRRNP